jgi:hypothetical protein
MELGMIADEKVLFPDTNTLLHYPPIKDVAWKDACGVTVIRLVLCMQVIHELDAKKDDPRLGDRARRAIKEVETILDAGGIVAEDVTLEVFNYEIRASDFPDTLSPDSADDRIVHSVKEYVRRHGSIAVCIYSEDIGMRLRCKAHAIETIKPDSSIRLPAPSSEQEKKYKAAIAELHEMKSRAPKLEVVITKVGLSDARREPVEFILSPVPEPRDLEAELAQYIEANDLHPLSNRFAKKIQLMYGIRLSDGDFDNYNAKLEDHLDEYKGWLRLRMETESIAASTFHFAIWLKNQGTAPAEDIDLELQLPDVLCAVYNANDKVSVTLLLQPLPPSPPRRPFRNRSHAGLAGVGKLTFSESVISATSGACRRSCWSRRN